LTRSVGSREAEIYIKKNLSKPEKKHEYASWAYLPHFRNTVLITTRHWQKRKEVSLKLSAKPSFCNSDSTGITQSLGSSFG
jgi:hypothetical protein